MLQNRSKVHFKRNCNQIIENIEIKNRTFTVREIILVYLHESEVDLFMSKLKIKTSSLTQSCPDVQKQFREMHPNIPYENIHVHVHSQQNNFS